MHINNYLVIAGSTRPNRRSPVIAQWVATLAEDLDSGSFRVVDLRDLNLDFDNEPGIPAVSTAYTSPATRNWSELVSGAKGIVVVTPQYNWGYPASLKNAIDHLYLEWRDKPVLIVTYGGHGGGKCGAQLREVLGGMGVRLTDATPGLRLARARIEANDGQVDPGSDFADQRDEVIAAIQMLVALSSTE